MLREFVEVNRDTILEQARERVIKRSGPTVGDDRTNGLPVFLDQLGEALRKASSRERIDHTELQGSAHRHGHSLFHHGLTVDQVVHDYGDLCQVITGLAFERHEPLPVEEFQTLNLCLDDAIAGAVTAYARSRETAASADGNERLGVLAHEMRNIVSTAILTFSSIQRGIVSPSGSTGATHAASLMRMNALIDRSLADVRLDTGLRHVEHLPIREVVEEVAIGAYLMAEARGVQLAVSQVDHTIIVEADRQILIAALANLVQNAFKFTARGTTVALRASATPTRVLVEVQDECGGLPTACHEKLLQPFTQAGHDRTGLGLGLSICLKAVKSMAGELHIRDVPGIGCVFIIDLPRQPLPALRVVHEREPESSQASRAG